MSNVRPEVEWFAEEMEKVLKENDWKCGWKDCSVNWLIMKLVEEVGELSKAVILNQAIGLDKNILIKESVDVANVAMMIADVVKLEISNMFCEQEG